MGRTPSIFLFELLLFGWENLVQISPDAMKDWFRFYRFWDFTLYLFCFMGTKLAFIFERDDPIYKFDMCCLFTVMARLNLATRNMIKKRNNLVLMQKTMLLAKIHKHQLIFVKIYKIRPVMKTILAKTRKMGSKSLMKTCRAHSCTTQFLKKIINK